MFCNGPRSAVTIVDILAKQRRRRSAGRIDQCSAWFEPQPHAGGDQTHIKLGIFVVREPFIIAAYSLKRGKIEQRMMAMIDEPTSANLPVRCAASA